MALSLLANVFLIVTMHPPSDAWGGCQDQVQNHPVLIMLPAPNLDGSTSVEQAMLKRRSVREYAPTPLTLNEVSQLCWAAQGMTNEEGLRSSPSAGALYPLELLLVAENVAGIDPGLYRYRTSDHSLTRLRAGRFRGDLAEAALGQEAVRHAPAIIVLSAVPGRTTKKYGERGFRYIHMEAGHAAQNIALQAVALNLGCVTVGAFRDAEISRIFEFSDGEEPLYLLPVGHPSP